MNSAFTFEPNAGRHERNEDSSHVVDVVQGLEMVKIVA